MRVPQSLLPGNLFRVEGIAKAVSYHFLAELRFVLILPGASDPGNLMSGSRRFTGGQEARYILSMKRWIIPG